MCGFVIVARTRSGPPLDAKDIERRRDALSHRGPDDSTLELVDEWVGFGFRRLAIIDVAGARQPLRDESGNTVCVFNGEIYNFVQLRTELRTLGHTFLTEGDGEVLVHGYEQWGTEVFARIEGMFAVALVDRRQRRMIIARDRFGIKPLFYRVSKEELVAASELKAIVGRSTPPASALALELGAMRMHVPWPLTAFKGIFRLPPGACLEFSFDGRSTLTRVAAMIDAETRSTSSPEQVVDELQRAVTRQMVADVPVGAFLSGGIDSSLIATLMRSATTSEIHTFSIKTLEHDESDTAADTARAIGTTHHTIALEDIRFSDLVALPELFDEPFAETSALGVRALSRFARERVKVALSGDGGDEVFGGYGSYRWIRIAAGLPSVGRSSIGATAQRLLAMRAWPPHVRRALRAALLFGDEPATAQRDVTTLAWAADPIARLHSEELSARIAATCPLPDDVHPFRRAMVADRLERLPNAMLAKVDIASMRESLEVRVPMLDDALVRYADHLPLGQLASLRHGKLLLRRTLAKLGGDKLAWASKRGFSLPLDRWMRGPTVSRELAELFSGSSTTLRELTGVSIAESWRTYVANQSRYSSGTAAMQLLWFANVALWADRFGVRTVATDSVDALPVA